MRFKMMSNRDRKLNIDWEKVNRYVSRFKPDTWFDIDIKRHTVPKLASKRQRGFYFGYILGPFMKELGYDKGEEKLVHHQLKVRYFEHDPDFKIYQDERGIWRNVPSVFSLDPDIGGRKRKAFVEWVIRKAAENGVYIEDPN